MALVSGGRSRLNPNAPLFIPAVYRQVEDFSPEWWQLVTTSTWYRDYWMNQHQDEDGFYNYAEDDGTNIADLLPDTFDLIADEDLFDINLQLDELVQSYEMESTSPPSLSNTGTDINSADYIENGKTLTSLETENEPKNINRLS